MRILSLSQISTQTQWLQFENKSTISTTGCRLPDKDKHSFN